MNFRGKFIFAIVLLFMLLCLTGCGFGGSSGSGKSVTGTLEVHYIDVGQGDAIFITCEGESMLIDAGDNSCGTKVQNYLLKQGVSTLKYAIGTHPGADHIGGFDVVLYHFDCETVFLTDQADAKSMSTKSYESVLNTLKAKSQEAIAPKVGDVYALGGAEFTILSPSRVYEDSNDASICVRLCYGDTSFLFTADATKTAESDMLASGLTLKSDVYKVGHHGSNTSTSEAFLTVVNPSAAVISCGANNSYGHPTEETLAKLAACGVTIFRTDLQGTIVATSDGTSIAWNVDPVE